MSWECGYDGAFVTPEPDRSNCTEDWIYDVEENVSWILNWTFGKAMETLCVKMKVDPYRNAYQILTNSGNECDPRVPLKPSLSPWGPPTWYRNDKTQPMLLSAMCDIITKQLCCCLCQCSGQWSIGCDVNTDMGHLSFWHKVWIYKCNSQFLRNIFGSCFLWWLYLFYLEGQIIIWLVGWQQRDKDQEAWHHCFLEMLYLKISSCGTVWGL